MVFTAGALAQRRGRMSLWRDDWRWWRRLRRPRVGPRGGAGTADPTQAQARGPARRKDPRRLERVLELARRARREDRPAEALDHVLAAIALEPGVRHPYTWLHSLAKTDALARHGLEGLGAIFAGGDLGPDAHFARADLLLWLRRFNEAFESYRRGSWQHARERRPDLFGGIGPDAPRRPPDFLVLGVMKCGTTSLFRYLASHSRVLEPVRKELHYWDAPTLGAERPLRLKDYLCLFPPDPGRPGFLVGEGTPATFFQPVAEQIARDLPHTRFLLALRDPVERAVSEYHHAVRMGREARPLEEALLEGIDEVAGLHALDPDQAWRRAAALRTRSGALQRSYLWKGLYDVFLHRWLGVLPRERFLFVDFRALVRWPIEVTDRAQRFLGLAPERLREARVWTRGSYDRATVPAAAARLREAFAPHVRRVHELTGIDLHGPPRVPSDPG